MKSSWSYGINSHCQTVSLFLREEPWWLAISGWFINKIISRGCCLFHWVKMPSFLTHTEEGGVYTWREWYGDLGDMYYMFVANPLFQWYYNHKESRKWFLEIGYPKAKELFYQRDKDFFDNHESL